MRSECSNLMKDLAETKNKLQQEELQRKSLEVSYKQSVSQLEVRVNSIHTLLFQLWLQIHILFFFFFFYICPWKSCICTVHQAQLQDAKRRWEELQSYLHSVNTEREKLQAAKQGRWCRAVLLCFTHIRKHIHGSYQYHSLSELQSQLLAVETEMNNKNKEIQTLHSSLTDTMVSKEQVEQKVMQLLEVSQHNLQPDNSLQAQVQVPCVLFFN